MKGDLQAGLQSIIDAINNLMEPKLGSLKYDKTYRAKVTSFEGDNIYGVQINGKNYKAVYTGEKIPVGQIVKVKAPLNNFSDIYIETLPGSGKGEAGNYNDLLNKPILNTNNTVAQVPKATETIQGTISLHKVSKTGNYNDLLNKPTLDFIPTSEKGAANGVARLNENGKVNKDDLPSDTVYDSNYVHTDNNFTTALKDKLNSVESGAQANKIENVQKNGTTLSITNKTVNITVPTKTSELTNDNGFISSIPIASASRLGGIKVGNNLSITQDGTLNAEGGGVTAYEDLTGKPILNTANSKSLAVDSAEIINGIVSLHKISKTGSYNDLLDKPTIPTKTSQLTNDSNFVTDSNYVHTDNNFTTAEKNKLNGIANGAQVNTIETVKQNGTVLTITDKSVNVITPTKTSDLTNDNGFITNSVNNLTNYYKKSETYTQTEINNLLSDKADKGDIPTKTSQLTNDSGFITNSVNNLTNYYLKTETYTQAEVKELIGQIKTISIVVVDSLPTTGESNKIYLVPKTGTAGDIYNEYIWVNDAWELIGSTQVDLTGYATQDWVNNQIKDFLNETQVTEIVNNSLTNYYTKTQVDTALNRKQNTITGAASSVVTENLAGNVVVVSDSRGKINDSSITATELSYISGARSNLQNQIDTITTSGGQPNVIEVVQQNGTALPITNKTVNVTVPTKTSELDNDSNFLSTIPIASSTTLGGIKVGDNLTISSDGTLNAQAGGVKSYTDLTDKPALNTNNSKSLTPQSSEIIQGTISLHKVSKTGNYNDLNNKLNLENGSGTGAVKSLQATGATGAYSFAEGYNTTSSGAYSHAEGAGSKAEAYASHAEGAFARALSQYSHTEGGGTLTGCHVFNIISGSDNSTKQYILDSVARLKVGMSITIRTGGVSLINQTITAIDTETNTITVSEYQELGTDENYIICLSDPSLGNTIKSGKDYSHAEGYNTIAYGEASHTEGSEVVASGDASHAEGSNTIASGSCSHAEGSGTIASAGFSHTEGGGTLTGCYAFNIISGSDNTTKQYVLDSVAGLKVGMLVYIHTYRASFGNQTITAIDTETNTITVSGYLALKNSENYLICISNPRLGTIHIKGEIYTHAEGYNTTAYEICSHAEGNTTVAFGSSSHSEGSNTIASGSCSHAEGFDTIASGSYSHTEGRGTIASRDYSHAQGSYNIASSNYLDVIGNGESDTKRSNAYTLDYKGNGWFAGDLYVGQGTTNSNKIATEKYVNDNIVKDYNNLLNKPTLNTNITTSQPVSESETITGEMVLHKISKTGDYNDLLNKPVIPAKTSDLTNDSGFITNSANNLTNYYKKSETYTQTEVDNLLDSKANATDIPTKISELTNDSDFITNAVDNLTNYYKKSETYTQTETDNLLNNKANKSDIPAVVNNLTSTSTTSALSANQGKVLNDKFASYLPLTGGSLSGSLTVNGDIKTNNGISYVRTYRGVTTNFNQAKTHGFYSFAGAATGITGSPVSSGNIYGTLEVTVQKSATWVASDTGLYIWQKYMDTAGRLYTRYASNSETFGVWRPIYLPESLYNNASGSTGTITLSSSAANYSYLEIFYKDTGGDSVHSSTKVASANGKIVTLQTISATANSNTRTSCRSVTVSGTNITTKRSSVYFSSSSGNDWYSANEISIYKVLGYR